MSPIFAPVAVATCGEEGENPKLTISPNPIIFSGAGTTKTATIQNTGDVRLENIATSIGDIGYFAPTGAFTCNELSELKVGAACFESVKCVKSGKPGLIVAYGEPPKGISAVGEAVLKC